MRQHAECASCSFLVVAGPLDGSRPLGLAPSKSRPRWRCHLFIQSFMAIMVLLQQVSGCCCLSIRQRLEADHVGILDDQAHIRRSTVASELFLPSLNYVDQ